MKCTEGDWTGLQREILWVLLCIDRVQGLRQSLGPAVMGPLAVTLGGSSQTVIRPYSAPGTHLPVAAVGEQYHHEPCGSSTGWHILICLIPRRTTFPVLYRTRRGPQAFNIYMTVLLNQFSSSIVYSSPSS